MRLVVSLALGVVTAMLGCGDDASETDTKGTRDLAKVAEALTRGLMFEGAEVRSGDLPATDDDSVQLLPRVDAVLMAPGLPSVMPFDVINPHDDDEPVATLMQFAEASEHLHVPLPGVAGERGGVDNRVQVSAQACAGLCVGAYLVTVNEALALRSGKVGRRAVRTVLLDCREAEGAIACSGDEATPDASVNQPIDTALQVAERVRAGLLDTVKAVCACDAAVRPAALVCAGTLAAVNTDCHAAALRDYAASAGVDLVCAIDGADSAPRCLEACDADTAAECVAEFATCGLDLDAVERALLSCETFACADGADRVDGSRLCDGTADCADASDEASAMCSGGAAADAAR